MGLARAVPAQRRLLYARLRACTEADAEEEDVVQVLQDAVDMVGDPLWLPARCAAGLC